MTDLRHSRRRHTQRGLTLIELMVVIVILGVLSTIVAVNVLPSGDRARQQAVETQIAQMKTAMNIYRLDFGTYPTADQGLAALVAAPQNLRRPERYRTGGYLDTQTVPLDPWDTPYQYVVPGQNGAEFQICSYGRDGRPGGQGIDADICR